MKALSLKQPFAELILQGRKKIELRKWNTKFRGEFLIHASKSVDKKAMQEFGFLNLPTGCIVGKAELIEVKHYLNKEEHQKDNNLHLASSDWGKYGFILVNVKRVKNIPCNGSLNFWECDLDYKSI
jgi:predicted transcriptional regulator